MDARVVTRLIRVVVVLSWVVVDDLDRLQVHDEGTVIVVGLTTGPFNRSCGVVRITASPDANADGHRGLRVVLATDSIRIFQSTYNGSITNPLGLARRPVDSISVVGFFGAGDVHSGRTIVGGRVAFAEVVGLDFVVICTNLFLWGLAR